MNENRHTRKIILALCLLVGVNIVLASSIITGNVVGYNKNNKYSLSNLSLLSRKTISLYNLKSGLQFRGNQFFNERSIKGGGLEINSMLQFEHGNTTYIMPYKFKVKVPKFKTPSPASF